MSEGEPPSIARLRLLTDQPVEGCELNPDVFLADGVSVATARLEWRWYRSTDKMACSWCGKTPVVMQRLTDNSYYCSVACFLAAWPGHAAQHSTKAAPKASGAATEGKDAERWAGLEVSEQTTEQKWVVVSDTQHYTPSPDDVGHMLKLVRRRPAYAQPAIACHPSHAPP